MLLYITFPRLISQIPTQIQEKIPILSAVLLLNSLNYFSGEQGQTTQHS